MQLWDAHRLPESSQACPCLPLLPRPSCVCVPWKLWDPVFWQRAEKVPGVAGVGELLNPRLGLPHHTPRYGCGCL